MNNGIDTLFRYLPLRISCAVHSLPDEILASANEIRIRKNAPVSVTAGKKNVLFTQSGRICKPESALCASVEEFDECLLKLTGGSLYTCDEYINRGFIPLAEGGRAGICGRANPLGGFAEIYSINLRIHRFLPYVARPLIEKYVCDGLSGTLVCSPPALGKTTFLRSAAYMLSSGIGINPLRVGIADERCEIAAGIPRLGLSDVISSMPKAQAVGMLTRTMSPEVIICDEIGADEVNALAEAQSAGVCLIASAHCKSPCDLEKRGRMKTLLDIGLFPLCVMLGYNGLYTCEIAETEALL